MGVYCKELQEANFHAAPLAFTLLCALEANKTGTEHTLILSFKTLFCCHLNRVKFCLCSFVFAADENDEGARFTHKASLLLAPSHSPSERQKHSWYVLALRSSTVHEICFFVFLRKLQHLIAVFYTSYLERVYKTFPTCFWGVMMLQIWFRNKAFVFFCDAQRIISSTVPEGAEKKCFLSNINAP